MLIRLETLALRAMQRAVGDDDGVEMRIAGLQRFDHGDGGIVFVMDAEHDLDRAGIILGEEAFQIFRQAGLAQMQGLEDGDGRVDRRRPDARPA